MSVVVVVVVVLAVEVAVVVSKHWRKNIFPRILLHNGGPKNTFDMSVQNGVFAVGLFRSVADFLVQTVTKMH